MAARSRLPTYHLSTYYVSRLLHDVTKLERALDGRSRSASWTLARQARKSARRAVRIAGSVALQRPEAFRLAGRVQWLLGAPERALRWWAKSLAEAERLDARPALARTYMEIGERLAGSREPHTLNGMRAAGCLARARQLGTELGLELDPGTVRNHRMSSGVGKCGVRAVASVSRASEG